jgi:hypothetical protein
MVLKLIPTKTVPLNPFSSSPNTAIDPFEAEGQTILAFWIPAKAWRVYS